MNERIKIVSKDKRVNPNTLAPYLAISIEVPLDELMFNVITESELYESVGAQLIAQLKGEE